MKSLIRKKNSGEKGSILIITLCFLFMMSLFALAVGSMVRQRLLVASRLEAREKLRYIAEASVKKAAFIAGFKGTENGGIDALTQSWSHSEPDFKDVPVGDGSFTVLGLKKDDGQRYGLIDEESKINLNKVQKPEVLVRLFTKAAQIPPDDALALAYSIMDWRDADEDAHDIGAESRYYMDQRPPYKARNGDIGSLTELLYIKGMTPQILEALRPYITLDGSSAVNINTASDEVLSAVGIVDSLIVKIHDFRKGRDRIEGTLDDGIFDNAPGITKKLQDFEYLDPAEVELMDSIAGSGQLAVFSTYFSVESVAKLNYRDESLVVHAVVNKLGEIKRWQEEYLKISS